MTRLEIVAETLDDAKAAQAGGADSIELALDLAANGLTPPIALVKAARDAIKINIHVIIRPHNRGFVYGPADIEIMLKDAQAMNTLGIQGIAVGAHLADGRFDVALMRRFQQAATNTPLTIHRALDSCVNADEALSQLRGIAGRILVSGKTRTAWEGRDNLREWVQQYGQDFRFAAAGSITLDNAAQIVADTGVHEIHTGSAARRDGVVDVGLVRALVARLKSPV